MKLSAGSRVALSLGVVAGLASLCATRAQAQNIDLKPTYGQVRLRSGFTPDPYRREVRAGGQIQTKLGGVRAWVANAPDFKLHYEAGDFVLTIYVKSKADTTLLINTPDGRWVADDDSGGNLNPLIRFGRPRSGRYDIYVGTRNRGDGNPPATLFITELKR